TGKTLSSPIVMLTGTGDPETIERARLAGVMNYVMKPINLGKLYAAIDLAIHQYVEVSSLRDVVVKLKDSLETRKLVDRGKALLMKQGLSEPQAYRKMQQVAMDKLKSMKEVAEAILLMSN
ncbi:MAG: ANTAR domain-containing protein, partial [Desulfuromonadales bacterium]|nr:ANTAR domain-containing protein [Desulfuromonadales bacterium]